MKVLFSVLLFAALFVAEAKASVFYNVYPAQVSAQVCNDFSTFPVQCQVTVYGYYYNGTYLYSTVALPLATGACEYAYVNNPAFAPFINGNAVVRCY